MKLAELLLQRAQLQSDLAEQTRTVSDNAQVLEGEDPVEDVEVVLQGQAFLTLLLCRSENMCYCRSAFVSLPLSG